MPPQKPPVRGQVIQRTPERQAPDEDDDDVKLPSFVEGTLSFFEALSKQGVTFAYVRVGNKVPCTFCALATECRLQVNRDGELMTTPICPDCKRAIGET